MGLGYRDVDWILGGMIMKAFIEGWAHINDWPDDVNFDE